MLSPEIGDSFCPGKTGNIEKILDLIKKQSILLAKHYKVDQKTHELLKRMFFDLLGFGFIELNI